MKKIYLLLFILTALTARSQNWQTVYSDRVQYFDSSRQAIKIIHKYVDSAGDSVFKNYTQYMIDSMGKSRNIYNGKIVDSTSWIGRRIVIKPNGYNGFANDSNELLWINTLADLGDTFTFIENNRVYIKAFCDSLYYTNIYGISDSVKRFKFTYNTKPGYKGIFAGDTSRFEVFLSKHYGLLKAPIFGEIIFQKNFIYFNTFTYNYFNRNLFTNYNFNNLETSDEYEFQQNDIYLPFIPLHNNVWRYYYQVVDKTVDTLSDTVTYKLLVKYLHTDDYFTTGKDPGTKIKITYQDDSVYFITQKRVQNSDAFMGLMPGQLFNGYTTKFLFEDTCNMVVRSTYYGEIDTNTGIFRGPFEQGGGRDYYSKLGKFIWYQDGSIYGGQTPVGLEYRIHYMNFCNTLIGNPGIKYTVFPYSVNETNKQRLIVYPNPAARIITISTSETSSINLTDLQGREIPNQFTSRDSETATLDVSGLANGIYLLRIHSGNSTTTHKLVVQH